MIIPHKFRLASKRIAFRRTEIHYRIWYHWYWKDETNESIIFLNSKRKIIFGGLQGGQYFRPNIAESADIAEFNLRKITIFS